MRLAPCDKLPGLAYKVTSNQRVIEAFCEKHVPIMEVLDYPQANAESCRSCLIHAAKAMTKYHIKVSVRKERVFLINTWLIGK